MWDLNRAERRALAASVFLVGLAGVSRAAWSPGPGAFEWRPVTAVATSGSPRDAVAEALSLEARAQTPLAPDERIDIATAPAEELRRLSGVGPSLAEAIIRERQARPFRSVADLDRVPGIGPATFARLRDRVEVGDGGVVRAPTDRASAGCGEGRLDLNAVGAERLVELPGVGPALAERITTLRSERGRFRTVSEIDDVRGIGEAALARLEPFLCVR